MPFNRAERRHHYHRMIAKRTKQNARYGVGVPDEQQWRFLHVRKRATTGAACTCPYCGNVRRKYGNSRASLTFQELVALDHLKERDE